MLNWKRWIPCIVTGISSIGYLFLSDGHHGHHGHGRFSGTPNVEIKIPMESNSWPWYKWGMMGVSESFFGSITPKLLETCIFPNIFPIELAILEYDAFLEDSFSGGKHDLFGGFFLRRKHAIFCYCMWEWVETLVPVNISQKYHP